MKIIVNVDMNTKRLAIEVQGGPVGDKVFLAAVLAQATAQILVDEGRERAFIIQPAGAGKVVMNG